MLQVRELFYNLSTAQAAYYLQRSVKDKQSHLCEKYFLNS